VREKEETIASMQRQIEELKRQAEQGSQQLQGEAQELESLPEPRRRFSPSWANTLMEQNSSAAMTDAGDRSKMANSTAIWSEAPSLQSMHRHRSFC